MVNGKLPEGWKWTTIGIETMPMQKRVNPQNYPELPYIGMENIEPHTMRLLGTVSSREMKSSADTFSPGDVLYGRLRPYLNKVFMPEFEGLCSTEFIVFRKVPHIYSKYLQYYLNSWEFATYANSLNAGDRPRVKFEQFADYPFPLPPLPEQERIVAKIEELFTQLEAGTAALKQVQAGLKRYKAAVLKAAVEGRLVDGGTRVKDGELPEGWRWVTLGELTKHLTSGSRGWANYYSDVGSLFIRVGNFNRLSKIIDLTKKQFVIAPQNPEANRTRLSKRDLLITMTADVGMVGIVDDSALRWGDAYINQHVGLVRLHEPEFVDFVAYALASEIGQNQFREKQYGATKLGLNFEDIRSLRVPLPPLAEQQWIVSEIERRLSVAQEIEAVVEASLKRAGRLRQVVLTAAFEGRLV